MKEQSKKLSTLKKAFDSCGRSDLCGVVDKWFRGIRLCFDFIVPTSQIHLIVV